MYGFAIIDKPIDWTSHDVVAKMRGILQTRAIGHAGTLDPLATGVLPLLVGGATKALDYLPKDKAYSATFRLGLETNTQDITGEVTAEYARRPTRAELEEVLPAFIGELEQIPPMVSAVKIGGRKLYELARQGVTIERPARHVTVYSATLTDFDGEHFSLDVHCSGGTYIRTIGHDIGLMLGCGAAMTALRRTMACGFTLAQAKTMEAWQEKTPALLPMETVFSDLPAITATDAEMERIVHGNPFKRTIADGMVRVYTPDGRFILLSEAQDGIVKQVKRFGL